MGIRWIILAIALIALATPAALIGIRQIINATATVPVVLATVLPPAALVILLVWRRIGSLLAAVAGALGSLWGLGLGVAAGFSGSPVGAEVYALIFSGLAVLAVALVDLIALLISGMRSRSGSTAS